MRRLQEAVAERYQLPAWTAESYTLHKHADRLAAASEAFHSRMIHCKRPGACALGNQGRPIWRLICSSRGCTSCRRPPTRAELTGGAAMYTPAKPQSCR